MCCNLSHSKANTDKFEKSRQPLQMLHKILYLLTIVSYTL